VIDKLLTQLEETDVNSDEFPKIVDQLEKLHKMLPKPESWVKPDILLPIFGNLIGIAAILHHEQAHVITTKALSFVHKIRV
jgi:hypothetical protein